MMPAQVSSPARLGYQMPAEWAKHEATWLSWPRNPETWPTQIVRVEETYARMIEALSRGEKVHLLVNDKAEETHVRELLSKKNKTRIENVIFFHIPTVDVWMRDYGPTFVRKEDGSLAYNHWIFNAWGGKYESLMRDTCIPDKLASFLKLPCFEPGIILEGGSIDVNGEGTVLTTEQCLLNKNRNPHLSRTEIETYLKDYLGVSHIVWLGEGIVGDDTDGHIDDISRFVSADTIVTVVEENKNDPNHEILDENLKKLEKARDQNGKPFRILTIPMPGPVECPQGRLPASYGNFYIGNQVILLPTYDHKNDEKAVRSLQEIFPSREVVGIPCTDLVYGLGAIHCVTQQQPAI